MFVARDRYGIKPLLYQFDDDKFVFGSEMKSILAYGVEEKHRLLVAVLIPATELYPGTGFDLHEYQEITAGTLYKGESWQA
ncbi:MAG: hypothetical protein WDO15_22265 [Bacteroidota bacterium]